MSWSRRTWTGIFSLLCIWAGLLIPAITSASTVSSSEDPFWPLDQVEQTQVTSIGALAQGLHQGCELANYDYASGSLLAAKGGFGSFGKLKRALGPAGDGKQWHHVVEQSKVGQFGANAIHSADNVVAISTNVHRKISGFFSSKQDFTGGQTVRQWLGGQSFDQQRAFGQQVLSDFGVGQ